ncbi:hypothetical protein KUCAC02_019914, partial [Chaenocephalus aceratus]
AHNITANNTGAKLDEYGQDLAKLIDIPILMGPNGVLYSLSHCVQTAMLQVLREPGRSTTTGMTWSTSGTLQQDVPLQ